MEEIAEICCGAGASGKGIVLDIRAVHYIFQGEKCPCYQGQTLKLLGRELSMLLGMDTTFDRKGSVLAIRAGH